MARNTNYSSDHKSEENVNYSDKYAPTGESEFSRESTVPFDQDEVLSERHYSFSPLESHGRTHIRTREPRSEPKSHDTEIAPKIDNRTDEMITEDANLSLYRHSQIDAREIEVFVDKGILRLKGFVADKAQKKLAESAVENIRGVIDIFNEIHLKFTPDNKPLKYGLTNNITGLN